MPEGLTQGYGVPISVVLLIAVAIVMTIIAAVKSSGGEHYRYPLTLRLIN